MKRLTPLLDENLPEEIAMKAINKVSPQIGKMLIKGTSQGLTLASGLNFLRSQLNKKEFQPSDKNLRPDEKAAERQISRSQDISEFGKNAAITGAGIAASSALPGMLGVVASGLLGSGQQPSLQEEKTKDPFEAISSYSPELSQFLKDHIQNGLTPEQAAALAKIPGKHQKVVQKIEKESGENFVDFFTRILGNTREKSGNPTALEQPVSGQNQTGSGSQLLMNILQKLNQTRGG